MAKEKPNAVVENGVVYVLKAGTPIYAKTAVVCSMVGKSNQWVGQLKNQGVLRTTSTPYGELYDVTETISSYTEKLEERTEPDEEVTAEKNRANMQLAKAKAAKASMEVQELLGKMHRSEDVAAMTDDLIFTMRNAWLSLPGRLTTSIAAAIESGETSAAEISQIIMNEVKASMTELAQYQYDAKKYEARVRDRLNKDAQTEDEE